MRWHSIALAYDYFLNFSPAFYLLSRSSPLNCNLIMVGGDYPIGTFFCYPRALKFRSRRFRSLELSTRYPGWVSSQAGGMDPVSGCDPLSLALRPPRDVRPERRGPPALPSPKFLQSVCRVCLLQAACRSVRTHGCLKFEVLCGWGPPAGVTKVCTAGSHAIT